MFSFTRFCLRVLADLNEIIRRMKQNVILTIAITGLFEKIFDIFLPNSFFISVNAKARHFNCRNKKDVLNGYMDTGCG